MFCTVLRRLTGCGISVEIPGSARDFDTAITERLDVVNQRLFAKSLINIIVICGTPLTARKLIILKPLAPSWKGSLSNIF